MLVRNTLLSHKERGRGVLTDLASVRPLELFFNMIYNAAMSKQCKHRNYVKGCLYCHLGRIGAMKTTRQVAARARNAKLARAAKEKPNE